METLTITGMMNKDCKIFTTNVEDEALSIIYNLLNHEAFKDAPIRIMPDVHAGKGITIGFSAPVQDMICPSHVGVDIGCMIDTYILDKEIDPKHYELLEHRIRKAIPFGMNINDKRMFDMKDFIKFMSDGYDKAWRAWPEMIVSMEMDRDFLCHDIDEDFFTAMLRRLHMDEGVFYKSIGSVGGGNHFIEIGTTPKNKSALTIHCGSRNFGVRVCKYWESIATKDKIDKDEFKKACKEIKKNTKDHAKIPELIAELKASMTVKSSPNGYLTDLDMKHYISDMVIAQLYAEYNHKIIAKQILEIIEKLCNAKATEHIVSVHNYIDTQDHIIRKGAIRSYLGEKMVIPFNMRDGLAICTGKSNTDWNCTAPHGAGRLMSRSKAKQNLSVDEFKDQMKGIYSTSVGRATIDEAPNAYKDTQEIIDAISETCDILYMIHPTINMKATDGSDE